MGTLNKHCVALITGLLLLLGPCEVSARRVNVGQSPSIGNSQSMEVSKKGGFTKDQTRSMARGVFLGLDFTANVAANCLPEVDEKVQELMSAKDAMPEKPSQLDDIVPLLQALEDLTDLLASQQCLRGAKSTWPAQISKALNLIKSGAGLTTALDDALAFAKKLKEELAKKDYLNAGEAIGDLLGLLASNAGSIPMLEGIADELGTAEEQTKALVQCASHSKLSTDTFKRLQGSFKMPKAKGPLGMLRGLRFADYAEKFQEVGEMAEGIHGVLTHCLPEQFKDDGRIKAFKGALAYVAKAADGDQSAKNPFLALGTDLILEFAEMRDALQKGNWKELGSQLGKMINSFAKAEAGLKAIDKFFALITGNELGQVIRLDTWVKEAQACMLSSQSLMDTFKDAFVPIDDTDDFTKNLHYLQQLSSVLDSAQDVMQGCNSGNVKSIAAVLRPEMLAMSAAINMAVKKASKDTQLLIKGLDVARELQQLGPLIAARKFDEVGQLVGDIFTLLNDQINSDSFLGGLLQKLKGGDGQTAFFETLPQCVEDIHEVGAHVRTAVFAMEISPRKWTIDKGDCEVAMNALKQVVKAAVDMGESCDKQFKLLKNLLKGFIDHKWKLVWGKLEMFEQDIGKPMFELSKAVMERKWAVAGQQVAKLGLLILDVSDHFD